MDGQIQLIIGPMFAGKTTEMMRRIRRLLIAHKKCIIIKSCRDTRHDDDCVVTHDGHSTQAVVCNKLYDIAGEVDVFDVIGIDEGQFFTDITQFSEDMAQRGKTVIIASLDGTFERKPFGDVLQLIPLAERVDKLTSICECGSDAAFTKRTCSETALVVVGGSDKYAAACRRCFSQRSTA